MNSRVFARAWRHALSAPPCSLRACPRAENEKIDGDHVRPSRLLPGSVDIGKGCRVGSLDLICSQASLRSVNDLAKRIGPCSIGSKPGGFLFPLDRADANSFSPFGMALGQHRPPVAHCARAPRNDPQPSTAQRASSACPHAGFDVLSVDAQPRPGQAGSTGGVSPFRHLGAQDLHARGAMLILRKPQSPPH